MTFAKRIKGKRVEKKMTQKQLAQEIGVSLRTIQNYELGSCIPNQPDIIKKLCDTLELSTEDLMQDDDGMRLFLKGQNHTEESVQDEIQRTLNSVSALFAGGRLNEKDKDALIRAIMEVYWQNK